MSKHTVRNTEASMSESEHSSLANRILSIGTEPMDWTGPNVHNHRPSADVVKAAGDQPTGYLGTYKPVVNNSNPTEATARIPC